MEYNYSNIGRRIILERKKKSLSQEELIQRIRDKGEPSIGRNTLSKLENGDQKAFNAISIAQLISICEEFDCSISYLLGEYEYRNYDNKFICEKLGLTEKAIENLTFLKTAPAYGFKEFLNILNRLLGLPEFTVNLSRDIYAYLSDSKTGNTEQRIKLTDKPDGRIKKYDQSKEVALWTATNHFTRIIEGLANQRTTK